MKYGKLFLDEIQLTNASNFCSGTYLIERTIFLPKEKLGKNWHLIENSMSVKLKNNPDTVAELWSTPKKSEYRLVCYTKNGFLVARVKW